MSRINLLRNNMTGGEVSPRIFDRPDVTKVANGCKAIVNGLVLVHGGVQKRSGTRVVAQLQNTTRHRFIRFQSSLAASYLMILGHNTMWFVRRGGLVTHTPMNITGVSKANPGIVTSVNHGFATGQRVWVAGVTGMAELNNRWFVVGATTANTFELQNTDTTGYETFVSGGTAARVVELTTTYTLEQLHDIDFQQINDVMYLVHPDHPPRKLTRSSDTDWVLGEVNFSRGPWRTINPDKVTLQPSAPSESMTSWGTYPVGTIFTLTASSSVFTSAMVGAHLRLYESDAGTSIPSPPIGDKTQGLANGQSYSYQGNVYGVSNVTGVNNWQRFTRVPEHTDGVVRVSTQQSTNGKTGQAIGTQFFDSYFLHPGYCIAQITSFTSTTQVTIEVVRFQMPNSIAVSGTTVWQESAWSDRRGWPWAVTLYEQRLFVAGSRSDPGVIWGSRSGLYEDFSDGDQDDDAISYRLAAGVGDGIRWIVGRRALVCGTSAGEYAITASSQQEGLTPSNIKAILQTDVGTAHIRPVAMNQAVLYPQRFGMADNPARTLREFAYAFTEDRFNSVDLTIYAQHIFGEGLVGLAYQRTPSSVIYAARVDGTIAGCSYERQQDVVAWWRYAIGGSIKEIETVPCANGDDLYMQVNRIIDGVEVAYLERLQQPFYEAVDEKEQAWMLDAALRRTGAPTQTISGLWHLRGEAVTIVADGAVETGVVDAGGRLTLERPASVVTVGKPYTMVVEMTEFEAGAQQGTARTRPKTIGAVWMGMLESLGGSVGVSAGHMKPLRYRTARTPMDASPPLFSGWIEVDVRANWAETQTLRVEHAEPLPFMMIAAVVETTVSG